MRAIFFFNCIDVIILQYDSKHKRRTYEFAKEEKIIVFVNQKLYCMEIIIFETPRMRTCQVTDEY